MCYVHYVDEPIPFADNTFEQSDGIIRDLVHEMGDHNVKRHSFFCLLLCAVLIFVILLMLRITGTTEMSFVLIFTPLFIGFGVTCFLPIILDNDWVDRIKICSFIWFSICAPALVFCVLLAVKLDGSDIRLTLVFIPFWVWNAGTLCLACFITFSDHEKWPVPMWCVVVMPMLVFEILLAVYFDSGDHGMTFASMFTPFYAWELGWLIMGCFITHHFLKDRYNIRLLDAFD